MQQPLTAAESRLALSILAGEEWFNLRSTLIEDRRSFFSTLLSTTLRRIPHYSPTRDGLSWDEIVPISRAQVAESPEAFQSADSTGRLETKIVYESSGTSGGTILRILHSRVADFDVAEGFLIDLFENVPELKYRDCGAGDCLFLMLTGKACRQDQVSPSLFFSYADIAFLVYRDDSLGRDSTLEKILALKPVVLHADGPTLIDLIARLEELGVQSNWAPAMIITSGHALYPDEKSKIQLFFGNTTRIVDCYASTEMGVVAIQYPSDENWMSVRPQCVAEVLLSDGSIAPEGTGELVLSNLVNSSMRLLRYRTGDFVDLRDGGYLCLNAKLRMHARGLQETRIAGRLVRLGEWTERINSLGIHRFQVLVDNQSILLRCELRGISDAARQEIATVTRTALSDLLPNNCMLDVEFAKIISDNEKYFRLIDRRVNSMVV
jgi:hypothetical protein